MAIRVLLVDDHHIVRDGMRALIERQEGMEVAAEAENGRKALQMARRHKPDIVIMDIGMPDLNGIDASRKILEELPEIRIIALSMHGDKQFVQGMLRAGVKGYLIKDCASEELIRSIRVVRSGNVYISPYVATFMIEDFLHPLPENVSSFHTELSTREREVLQLIAEGRSTKTISEALHISVKTVETHRKNIMDKVNLHTVADLTKYAIRYGLTSVESPPLQSRSV
jgi:DNA-binding NarL/FixJ family response regulator